ncbi:hypothetical protein [Pararhodonellum marinum]|uniref:hypothetical protein n=1 Tax=Pararhodonellum marinum TaxID=2755358 RepID=UPI00188F9C42|nr:hypothetical protein [Pararhodonellum marinum]
MEKEINIRLSAKQLPSGNCQVKFFVEDEQRPQYGYLLVQEPKTVGEIISEIRERMEKRMHAYHGLNPFSVKTPLKDDHNFYLYTA